MQSVEKQVESDHRNAHSFPSIEKSLEKASCQNNSGCNSFRPMFQFHDDATGKSAHDAGNHCTTGDGPDALEQIREKRFLEGLEAGKAEACKIIQNELETPVHQFLNENDRYFNCFDQITSNYSDHIVGLALAISRKIVGDHCQLNGDHLESISHQLHTLLKKQYRLSAKFNRDDIESLTELLACVRPQWKQSDALDITGDDETRKGQVQFENSDASIETVKDKFKQKVEEILSAI